MLGRLQLRNEWRVLRRQPLVWLAVGGFTAFSTIFAMSSPVPSGDDPLEALLRLNLQAAAYLLPFLAGALGPVFYLREVDHGMRDIFGSYPVTLRDWLATRLSNFFLVLLGCSALSQIAFIAFLAADHPDLVSEMVLRSAGWLLVLHGPACLLWSCLLARLSCQTGHAGILYVAAGLCWATYMAVAAVTGTPLIGGSIVLWQPLQQAMLVLDPYAITALVNPMPETGPLQSRALNIAIGRAIWLAACVLLLRGIRELPSLSDRKSEETRQAHTGNRSTEASAPRRFGHIGIHLRYFRRDRVFFLLVGGWILLLLPESYGGLGYAEPLSLVVPDSRDALNRVAWDIVPQAGTILLLYAADRICRMYSAVHMHELVATSPYRSERLIAVQLASLWLVATFFLVLAGLSVALAQLAAGSEIQPGEFALQLGLVFPQLALACILFTAVHGLIRQRFVANLVNLLLVVLGFSSLAPAIGLRHPLWKPLDSPLEMPDHYWGFEGSLAGHLPFTLFWALVCIAALTLATVLFHRNMPFAQVRWRTLATRPATGIAVALLATAALPGSAIHRSLADDGALVTADDNARRRADYERAYLQWSRVNQPAVAEVRSRVDFDPDENGARLQATMRLVNLGSQPIGQILVGRNQMDAPRKIILERASALHRDERLGQIVFQLDRPMLPGDSRNLYFETALAQSGFETASMHYILRPSFSSLPAFTLLPIIGFERQLTLRDPAVRKEQGLPQLNLTPPSRLAGAPLPGPIIRGQAILDTVVSTKPGHFGIAQGELVERWQRGGRAFFHYRSTGPIRNLPAYFSVPWQPQEWKAGRVALQVFAPEKLDRNNPNALGMADTLAWLDREVAPYPGRSLRMIAVPEVGLSGFALPQTLLISHRLGFRAQPTPDAGFGHVYRRAVHETAHQWFGHLLGYGNLEERSFLVESLAKYAELVMIERRYGRNAMLALVDFEGDRYRQSRLDPDAAVVPIIDADDDVDQYSRATLTFACLREKVGDEPILAALRQVATNSRTSGAPARSLDFVDGLKASVAAGKRTPVERLFLGTEPLNVLLERVNCNARI